MSAIQQLTQPGADARSDDSRAWAYDEPSILEQCVTANEDGTATAKLLIEGITCAGCIPKIERQLCALPGIASADVNSVTHLAEIVWRQSTTVLGDVISAVHRLGYRASPHSAASRLAGLEAEYRTLLKRFAIAALLAMQIMMCTLALYFGAWNGISDSMQTLLRWTSLLLSIPLVFYAGRPFFSEATASLKRRSVGMDVPVALAIALTFVASAVATITSHGDVYFESMAMFIALLTLSRLFELRERLRACRELSRLDLVKPEIANVIAADGVIAERLASEVEVGALLLVRPGESAPADGVVTAGTSSFDESLLTGESSPVLKNPRDFVVAGSSNLEAAVEIRATARSADSTSARLAALAERAQQAKPGFARLAERFAARFVVIVLGAALFSTLYWLAVAPDRAFPIAIAVLVVSCPCALALATPATLAAASANLMRHGIAILNPDALETLGRTNAVIFDKTGTLTTGTLTLKDVTYLNDVGERTIDIALALSRDAVHPVARALRRRYRDSTAVAESVRHFPGLGVSGRVDGVEYFFGSMRFLAEVASLHPDADLPSSGDGTVAVLASSGQLLAQFNFDDQLKPGTRETVAKLHDDGFDIAVFTGDNEAAAANVAGALDITDVLAALTPDEKLETLRQRQGTGYVPVVIGDGVNDAPMLATAMTSVAVGNSCDLAKSRADLILLNDDITALPAALALARRTRRTIRMNLTWALLYNVSALPLAIGGYIAPWVAAAGMSLSSILVVGNAARLRR